MPHVLIIEEQAGVARALAELARHEGLDPHTAATQLAARHHLGQRSFALILLAGDVPDGSTLDFLATLNDAERAATVLLARSDLQHDVSVGEAVAALRLGIRDYLRKPVDHQRLRLLMRETLTAESATSATTPKPRGLEQLVGESPGIRAVQELITRVAKTDATVLIDGETGTGKERVARALHEHSGRRGPFVAVNAGALPESLIESELFGHQHGTFTGAARTRKGIFEQGQGGTVFLDEVTEMPIDLQVKLLRVLETSAVTRVGGDEEIGLDVRVVAATNREPAEAVRDGKLREDLFYRLSVFPIHLPPLRDRQTDIPLLANYFLGRINREEGSAKQFTPAALQWLADQPWPGNVRELQNVIQRAHILADEQIDIDHLPRLEGISSAEHGVLSFAVGTALDTAERELILATLAHLDNNKTRAAEVLGISLKTLYNRLHEFGPATAGLIAKPSSSAEGS